MKEKLGQLFITGFKSETPSPEFLEFIESENIGGVILFKNNCNPHSQAEDSISEIVNRSREIPFIAVDQEGGRVNRFEGAPAEYPSAAYFGERSDIESFKESLSRAAYYLQSLGVNMMLGPVADLGLNQANKCLEDRTFSASAAKAMPFVESAVRTIGSVGMLSCLKHFPGLGAAEDDPHKKISVADFNLQDFLNREALPFKAGISAGADMVMTTHLQLTSIDNKMATESETVINLLLREKLNFDGIAITDDLLMKGAEALGRYGERALKAFNAGHDILLFGNNYQAARAAVEYFKKAYDKGDLDPHRLKISLERISGVKSKLSASAIL